MNYLPELVLSLAFLMVRTSGYIHCNNPPGSNQICGSNCLNVESGVQQSLSKLYLYNSLFVTFILESEESLQIDNICYNFFPQNGDPSIDDLYISRVYKNGTNEVLHTVVINETLGVYKTIGSGCNFRDTVVGSSPCDATITYRCYSCNGCQNQLRGSTGHPVFGLSPINRPINSCCLQQAEQVLEASGVPPQKYIILPMKLPHRCVKSPNRSVAGGSGYSTY